MLHYCDELTLVMLNMLMYYTPHQLLSCYAATFQLYAFISRVENNVDPDLMAASEDS